MQVPPFLQGFGTQYCRARVNTEKNIVLSHKLRCYTGISGLERDRNSTSEKYRIFLTCVDIANQLLTRHSPLVPLGQVDE